MPWIIDENNCVYKQGEDGLPEGEALGCHEAREEAEQQLAALEANVDEQESKPSAELVQETTVTELKGYVPSIPLAPGVNYEALLDGDDDPMFLVLSISEIGQVSKNGLLHDQELASELVQQINEERPGGIMGHIPDSERNTAYPESQIHWVGAIQDRGRVWARGYIPRTQEGVREEFRILKAKGGRAATSIYGRAVKEYDEGNTRRWRARQFNLEQIDLAPYKRASLPGNGEFVLMSEMADDSDKKGSNKTGENKMDREQILAELTAEDVRELSVFDEIKTALLAEFQEEHASEQRVTEMEEQAKAQKQKIAELEVDVAAKEATIAAFQEQQFKLNLDTQIAELTDWKVNSEDGKEKVDSLRLVIRQMALAKLGDERKPENVAETLGTLMADDLKPLVELTRDMLSGGAVKVPSKKNGDDAWFSEFITDSENAGREAMDELGLSVG